MKSNPKMANGDELIPFSSVYPGEYRELSKAEVIALCKAIVPDWQSEFDEMFGRELSEYLCRDIKLFIYDVVIAGTVANVIKGGSREKKLLKDQFGDSL